MTRILGSAIKKKKKTKINKNTRVGRLRLNGESNRDKCRANRSLFELHRYARNECLSLDFIRNFWREGAIFALRTFTRSFKTRVTGIANGKAFFNLFLTSAFRKRLKGNYLCIAYFPFFFYVLYANVRAHAHKETACAIYRVRTLRLPVSIYESIYFSSKPASRDTR